MGERPPRVWNAGSAKHQGRFLIGIVYRVMKRSNVAPSSIWRGFSMLPKEAFATVVRTLRQESRLSQDELTAIDQSHLSRVERGKVNVSLQMVLKIASMLKIEPAVLVLLTSSLQAGESAESAMGRAVHELKELKKAGAFGLLSVDLASRSPGRPSHPDTQQRIERAKELRGQGMTLNEIARDLNVSKATVHRYLLAPRR